jgi:membrane protease YdiL (CAAX protease family)
MLSAGNVTSRRHSILIFFCLVLAIGAVGYTPWVLASYNLFSSDLSAIFLIVGGVSPTLAAVVVATLEYGKTGPRCLFGQFRRGGFSRSWFLVAVGIPFVLSACAVLLWVGFGGVYSLDIGGLVGFPVILAANFLMNMLEEIGWRGYALPTLQRRYSALASSLMIGVFWTLWHWPQFAVKDSLMATNYHNFFWFAVFTLLISVSYSWLYNSTKGSLLVVSLYHSSINTVNAFLFVNSSVSYSVFPFYLLVTAILAFALILIFKPDSLSSVKKVTAGQVIERHQKP